MLKFLSVGNTDKIIYGNTDKMVTATQKKVHSLGEIMKVALDKKVLSFEEV
jgi:hypothetical protein